MTTDDQVADTDQPAGDEPATDHADAMADASADDDPTADTSTNDGQHDEPTADTSIDELTEHPAADEPAADDGTDAPVGDEPTDDGGSTGDDSSAAPATADTKPAADEEPSDDPVADDSDTSAVAATGPDESAAAAAPERSDDVNTATPEELADEIVRLRAETAALQKQLDESTKAEPKKQRKHRSGRWWGSTICVVLGAILLPMSVIGRWTSTTLLDTETYVSTVTPLAENADIREAVAFRVSEVIVEVIDIEALVRDDLPPGTRFLAGPIEGAARTLIDEVVEDFVSTDAFARFWADANRIGHEGVVAVFTGESTDRLDAAEGRVVLNVGPLVQGVITELDDILGLDVAGSIPEERLDGEFVIVDSEDLAGLQGTIKLFDQLSVIIPILTFALFAASIYLSWPRRIGWRNVGYAIIIPMALCLLLYTWVRGRYTGGLPDDIHNPDAAAALFDITTRFLTRDLWVVLVIGVIILFVSWLVGPTGWAGRARAWWKELVSNAGNKSASSEVGEFPRWIARNERNLLWATLVPGAATLLLWTLPTATVVLLIAVIVVLVMSGIHVLAEVGRKADADIQADEDAATEAAGVEAAHEDAAKLEDVDVTRSAGA